MEQKILKPGECTIFFDEKKNVMIKVCNEKGSIKVVDVTEVR